MDRTEFIHFKEVIPGMKNTWDGKGVLTFDIDWAKDEEIRFVLAFVKAKQVKCCFFVTHDTPVLQELIECEYVELGLHPNFNPLILAQSILKTPDQIITELRSKATNACVLRSHSMTTSGRYLELYKKAGIHYLSNYLMYGVDNIIPFYQINGLIEIPVYFADDGYAFLNDNAFIPNLKVENIVCRKFAGIRVYNFHPVHLVNNTTSFRQFDAKRKGQPEPHKVHGLYGAFDILNKLIV